MRLGKRYSLAVLNVGTGQLPAQASSVPLTDIVASELVAFRERVTISGPPVSIKQEIVQFLTLVLHALLTNTVKYGSLAAPGGRVAVSWRSENTREPLFSV